LVGKYEKGEVVFVFYFVFYRVDVTKV